MREAIGKALFGTTDVDGVLDSLSPSDALVKEFYRRMESAKHQKNITKGAAICQTQKIESHKH